MPAAALDSLRVAVDSGRIDAVAQLLEASSLPVTHRSVRALTSGLTGSLAVRSDPPGAEIWIERATPLATFADRSFRRITSEPTELVAGEYAVRLTGGAGADTLYRLARVTAGATTAFVAEWPVRDSIQGAFQRISAGRSPVDGVGIEGFLIAEREVTNAQFQRFVSAGGYRNVALWSPTMLVDGRSVPATEAIGRFVDRTGLLGPRDWESGRFPAAKGDHPVTGVSWYEADAYARWAGAALPSASQFWRAAQGDSLTIYPWGEDAAGAQYRANLEGVDTAPVGGSPLGVSRFGVMDLAGNVREWLTDTAAATSRRVTVGGSWQDPFYMADPVKAESFAPSYANRAIGFRVVRTLAPQPRN